MVAWSVVNGSRTDVLALNVTAPSCCEGCRCAANARAACIALAIGAPRMLWLASMTSPSANWFEPSAVAGTTVSPVTSRPFSVTVT